MWRQVGGRSRDARWIAVVGKKLRGVKVVDGLGMQGECRGCWELHVVWRPEGGRSRDVEWSKVPMIKWRLSVKKKKKKPNKN